jgi:futalosine hydrolase
MRILLVAATDGEVAPILETLGAAARHDVRLTGHRFSGHDVHVLITGVGMVATAAWCSRTLAERSYGLALNVGVCGSFDRTLEPGDVVHTISDRLVELGAEDDERFLTIDELNFPDSDHAPYTRAELTNPSPPVNAALLALPRVAGITVNTVHGNERSIAAVVQRFKPQVETMEGAAFMYACLIHGVQFAQVRAVSNFVEKRNREGWRIPEAIGSLATVVTRILEAG